MVGYPCNHIFRTRYKFIPGLQDASVIPCSSTQWLYTKWQLTWKPKRLRPYIKWLNQRFCRDFKCHSSHRITLLNVLKKFTPSLLHENGVYQLRDQQSLRGVPWIGFLKKEGPVDGSHFRQMRARDVIEPYKCQLRPCFLKSPARDPAIRQPSIYY